MSDFNMAVKENYTNEEWEKREEWYVKQIQTIEMPLGPTPQDLSNFANQIEKLLSIARFDWAYAKRSSYKYDMYYKSAKLSMYNELEKAGMIQPGAKCTVDEKKGYVETLLNKPYKNYGVSLVELVNVTKKREIFMDAVISSLQDKKDLIISHASAIKTEASLNNFSSSVPR